MDAGKTELHKKNNAENHWFSTFVLLGSGFGSLFFFVNASKWINIKNQQLNNPNKPQFDDVNADALYMINALLGVLLLAIFIWAIARVYQSRYPFEFEGYEVGVKED